jgi:tripartite-type tricarboxylate transporter receptor subunit TctC
METPMKILASALLAILLPLAPVAAVAQAAFPSKQVTLIVPVAPGGILDTVARMISPAMSRSLGQPIVVDNKPGASGNIGATLVARAPPDGYTLLVGYSMFHVGNPAMFKDLPWDPVRDFASVGMLVISPHVLAVHPQVPAKDLKELVALAKAQPGKLNYATPGSGSVPHVGMELFKQQTGTDFTHVPYKGAGPAMQDVIAGNVQVTVATPPSLLGFVQSGRMRALAVTARERHPQLPDVPTVVEAGYPDFLLEAWVALFAPAGTPPEAIAKLTAAAREALKSPEAAEKIRVTGMTMRYLAPADLDAVVKTDLAYWSKVITDAKIKAD